MLARLMERARNCRFLVDTARAGNLPNIGGPNIGGI